MSAFISFLVAGLRDVKMSTLASALITGQKSDQDELTDLPRLVSTTSEDSEWVWAEEIKGATKRVAIKMSFVFIYQYLREPPEFFLV